MKTCTKCGCKKRENQFYRRGTKGALRSWCKLCEIADSQKYNAANAALIREMRKVRVAKYPEVPRVYFRKWAARNPDKRRKNQAKWRRGRYRRDPEFRVLALLRTRVYLALKSSGATRAGKTSDLLGCSIKVLRIHLERLFKPGMTWENYGPVWHVDHKLPCAKFDLTDPKQQKLCFHWMNLQPLFAKENIAKGDRE